MDLPAKYGNKKKMTHPKIFFAKSLKLARWTCLPNMVSLAQWEVGPKKLCDYAYYNEPILMANSWRAQRASRARELSDCRRLFWPSKAVW